MKTFATIFACLILLSACNTVEGIGEDLQQLGRGLENKANEKK